MAWPGWALVALLVAVSCLGRVAAISVSITNSSYGVARTPANQIEMFGGYIYIKFIDRSGTLRQTDFVRLSFEQFRDHLNWKNDTAAPDCEEFRTKWETPRSWRVWYVHSKVADLASLWAQKFSRPFRLLRLEMLIDEVACLRLPTFGGISMLLLPYRATMRGHPHVIYRKPLTLVFFICRSQAGVNGTTMFGMNTTYARYCEISLFMILTDREVNIRVANLTIKLVPDVLKLSVIFDCPWKPVLLNQNLTSAIPSHNLTLYGRRHEILTTLEFRYSSNITNYPNLTIANDPTNYPSWPSYLHSCCANQRPDRGPLGDRFLLQPLVPGFNFYGESGISLPSEEMAASIYFLGWAWADASEFARIVASGDVREALASALEGHISMPFNLSIPFSNCAYYCPLDPPPPTRLYPSH